MIVVSCKSAEELTDIEKANRIIAELKRQNKELQDRYDVLKKAEERERW